MSDKNTAVATPEARSKIIVRTSILGIIANIFLVAFKLVIGLTANSIAIVSDAINNLTDALSSVITIVGTKLAGKAPDKKHPLGYGRIEYIAAFIVSAIVLYAGITTVVNSVKKIIHPEDVDYSVITLIILAAAVVVKIILGAYTKKTGKKVNSGSLVASGQDAFQDAILSASVLLSALIYILWHVKIEAYIGVVIGLFIIKAGIEMILDAVNDILGTRADAQLAKDIKSTVLEAPEVNGVYDLVINNYGPDMNLASLHVEINDTLTAQEIDGLSRRLQKEIYVKHGVILQAVGIYATNTKDDEAAEITKTVRKLVLSHEGVLQLHGFYVDIENHLMTFDVVLDFDVDDRKALYAHIKKDVTEAYPDYNIHITLDIDASD